MSTPFYDLASLVVVPSGYKSGKIYAQKPLTTDGQLTFTRASTATRVNASGLIESVASGVPRLDYTNSSCPKLLLEPQRSNLVTYSEQFNTGTWGSSSVGSVTANTTISPDGTQNADTYVEPGNGNYLFQSVTSSSGTFTVSLFAKKGSSTKLGIGLVGAGFTSGMSVQFNFDTQTFETPINYSNFTNMSATSQSYGNGWYRLALTGTTATATTYFFVLGSFPGIPYAANVRLWGAQCEAGAYATSYIPTTSAAVTRLADAASKTGISSLIGQTEGVIFLDAIVNGIQNNYANIINSERNATNSFYIHLGLDGILRAGIFANSVQRELTASSYSANQRLKIAFAYKTGELALYVNGVQKATSTASFTFNASLDDIFLNDVTTYFGYQENASYNEALLFKTRLTNAQLAELTSL